MARARDNETPEVVEEEVQEEVVEEPEPEAAKIPETEEAVDEKLPMTIDDLKDRFWGLIEEAKADGIEAPLKELGMNVGSRFFNAFRGAVDGFTKGDHTKG